MNNRNEIIQKSLYALDHMKNFTEFAKEELGIDDMELTLTYKDGNLLKFEPMEVLQETVVNYINLIHPRKPIYKKDETPESKAYAYECPSCGRFLSMNTKWIEAEHCIECGQALDWSE